MRGLHLGDRRLDCRLMRLVEALAAQPTASVPQACGDWAATKGAYRLWDSPRVKPEAIRAPHEQSTLQRIEGHSAVLVVQDTTNLDFTHHPATTGLGYLDASTHQGLKVHSALAVSVEGLPLGLVHQEVWTRDPEELGKHHTRRQRETREKESQRWLTGVKASQEAIDERIGVIVVADREADIYDLFAQPRRARVDILVRAAHNRRVTHEARYLWDAIRQSPKRGTLALTLRRKDGKPSREARLAIRYETMSILPPRNRRKRASLQPVSVQVILAEEEEPPPDVKPVSWLLLTTLPLNSFQDATRCLQWYAYRWLIERYHYVLKSGCRVEHLQLENGDRLQRALATYCIVAWRLLWLTYEARQKPSAPCDTVLETHEWQSLYCTIHKTHVPPATAPTLRDAVHWTARLGGFLDRRADGEPGVKTIWRGLIRLHDIADTWRLLHADSQLDPGLMGKA